MSEPKPIPIDSAKCLEALAQLTAFLQHLQEQRERNAATVSTCEPMSPAARFDCAAAGAHRAFKTLIEAIDGLVEQERLNQQMANLLATMKRNAEIFQKNLEANTLHISGTITHLQAKKFELKEVLFS